MINYSLSSLHLEKCEIVWNAISFHINLLSCHASHRLKQVSCLALEVIIFRLTKVACYVSVSYLKRVMSVSDSCTAQAAEVTVTAVNTDFLPPSLSPCLPPSLPPSLPLCLPACLPASACLPPFLPASLPACLHKYSTYPLEFSRYPI